MFDIFDIYLLEALINGVLLGGVLALLALGLNLIFGVIDVVWICYAELIMLGMYGMYYLFAVYHVPYLIAAVICIIGVGGLGVKLAAPEIRPESFGDVQFRVSNLPQEEVADAHLARRTNQQIGVGRTRS